MYFVGLINFDFEDTHPGKYLQHARLVEEETGEVFYNKLGFIFLELPDFNLKTGLEYRMYVLKNIAKLEKSPAILRQEIFQKLFG